MRRSIRAALVLLFCAAPWAPAAGPPAQVSLRWAELEPAVRGGKAAVALPDGTLVEGRVRGVERDGLRMRVTKTSNRASMAKGERLLPRTSLTTIKVTRHGATARLVCTVGAIGLALGIVAAQDIQIDGGYGLIAVPLLVTGGTAGAGVAGYYTGKRLDRRVTIIRVVPD